MKFFINSKISFFLVKKFFLSISGRHQIVSGLKIYILIYLLSLKNYKNLHRNEAFSLHVLLDIFCAIKNKLNESREIYEIEFLN